MRITTRGRILGRGALSPGALALVAVLATSLSACSASATTAPVSTPAQNSPASQATAAPTMATTAAPSQAANPGGIYANAPVAAASDIPAGSTMDKIKQRGDMIIGGSMDAPLWSQIDPTTGQFTGFDAEMGKLLAYYITGKPDTSQVVSSATQTREALLGAGTVDVVFQTYTITVQRATQVNFAGPYFTSGLVIATASGQPKFTALADLAGKTVIAGANTPAITAMAHPEAMTIHPEPSPLDFRSSTLATTPFPSRISTMVPRNSPNTPFGIYSSNQSNDRVTALFQKPYMRSRRSASICGVQVWSTLHCARSSSTPA